MIGSDEKANMSKESARLKIENKPAGAGGAKSGREKGRAAARPGRRRRALAFRWVYLLCFAVVLVVISCYALRIVSLEDKLADAREEKKAAQDEKSRLESEYAGLNTLDYWEQKSRDMLHMVKPEELLFISPERDGDADASTGAGESGDGADE